MRVRIVGVGVLLVVGWAASALAGRPCELPEAYPIALEARAAVLGTGRGVVAAEQPNAASPLERDDAVRQVNGEGIETCADVERAAAASFSRGLPLLVAVERPTGTVAVLVPIAKPTDAIAAIDEQTDVPDAQPASETAATPAARNVAVIPAVAVTEGDVPASARALAVAPSREPAAEFATDVDAGLAGAVGEPASSERADEPAEVRAEAEAPQVVAEAAPARALPEAGDAPSALRGATERAVEILQEIERNATMQVPIAIYERERKAGDEAMRAVDFGQGEAAAAVRTVVFDVLEMYHTASEVLADKLVHMAEMRQKMNVRAPREVPYFSDGDVPRWVEKYPFLQEAVLEPPKDRAFLQSSGRWNPDRAVELLWQHASEGINELQRWLGGN